MALDRLSLIIADSDEAYADSLIGFVSARYPGRFSASFFSSEEFLKSFFNGGGKEVDILLMDKRICESLAPDAKTAVSRAAKTVILLYGGECAGDDAGYPAVNKYQRGDRLVSDIMGIFAEKTGDGAAEAVLGRRKTRIVAVFSPAGGSGKTCVAVSSCIRCAQNGMSVFYLNFEDMQSTPLFFEGGSRYNLSNFLYFLKDKDENLALRIESMCCIEPDYGIHFFSPPECSLEKDELSPEELNRMIKQFRRLGTYDVVFIDMSSSFNRCSMALLQGSDEIFIVLSPEEICRLKIKKFFNELDILAPEDRFKIGGKAVAVMNKCCVGENIDFKDIAESDLDIRARLPLCEGIRNLRGYDLLRALDDNFREGINSLVCKYIREMHERE